ncbi:TPA: lipopolysaccharide biosynthesis protein RfbH [Candidatus Micrarchaeota archaeon]|nr:lipopolysaccharide biosynthesis protein RfbH [Candidatus Micrarchaeota archaeon]
MASEAEKLRKLILKKTAEFQRARAKTVVEFDRNTPRVEVSGRVFDEHDVAALVDASLEFWLTAGRFADRFESELADLFGLRHAMMVNSGSSANLVALSALTSRFLGERRLRRGDEVITSAVSFPTTVNPIFQNGLVAVFVDAELDTYNVDLLKIEEAITSRTKAVMVAHMLGNPFDAARLSEICRKHGLFLIEDCCDALGAKTGGKMAGTFGDFATLSFYPAHHITTGEGGAVLTDNPVLKRAAESMRDWGRDCWCKPGCDNTCGKRFGWKMGGLPSGYDHKYIYSNIGYNLKATDMQAALGSSQLKKLEKFVAARKENFDFYLEFFRKHAEHFVLPRAYPGAEPSPFGYLINIRQGAPFERNDMAAYLEGRGIATRMLFGGNIVRQPAYNGENFRVVGTLENADRLMNNTFWIGVYPAITGEMREYVAGVIEEFLSKY